MASSAPPHALIQATGTVVIAHWVSRPPPLPPAPPLLGSQNGL